MNPPQIEYFRAIHGSMGLTNAKDAKAEAFRRQFAFDFYSSINVEHNVTRNDVPQDFIITPTDEGCNIWARPGEALNIGDIIFWNTLHWLVTDINFHDSLTRSGKMVRCNRQVRWQNQYTGEIVERWCLITKPYTSNVEEGMTIATSNRQFKIQLPYDEETILVDLDRRFLLEKINGKPKAYNVISVDVETNRYQDIEGGFLIWNLAQGEYNPHTDNEDLMIADYFEAKAPVEPDTPLLPCRINGRGTIREGVSRRYNAVFYDADGLLTEEPQVQWSVNSELVETRMDGRDLIVSVPVGAMEIGTKFTVSAADGEGAYAPAELEVEVVGLL